MTPASGGAIFCPTCGHREEPTIVYDSDVKTPPLGHKRPPDRPIGASIFADDLDIEAPQGGGTGVDPSAGGLDATALKHITRRVGEDAVPEARPAHEGALYLPRCRNCNRLLELEEITDGECHECLRSRAFAREGRPGDDSARVRAGGVLTGALALLAASWVCSLVIVRAVRSNPDTWPLDEFVRAGARIGLVVYAIVASIAWARGRSWAAGAALALGPAAGVLGIVQVRTGTLLGDLPAASAWVLAGAAGVLAALAAAFLCSVPAAGSGAAASRSEGPGRGEKRRRGGPLSRWLHRAGVGSAGAPQVIRARAVAGGGLALVCAGLAGWRAAAAAGGMTGEIWSLLPVVGFLCAALAALALAVWLLARPPAGKTHICALLAPVLGGALPLWLMLAARRAGVDPEAALALPDGVADLLSMPVADRAAPGPIPATVVGAAAGGLAVALAASLCVFLGRSGARGKGLAGFALSWALVWTAGLAMALVRGL